ncbi:MAG: hypothetical protein GXP10_08945 [Gammaproteobacteria bacterium]|nr:hypothetical protein [Gammaproteobacteria bacterium]
MLKSFIGNSICRVMSGVAATIFSLLVGVPVAAHQASAVPVSAAMHHVVKQHTAIRELPIWKLPNVDRAVESYFSSDSKRLIFYAKSTQSDTYNIHTVDTDGGHLRRINKLGQDACSFFFPDRSRVVFTSTKDNLDMPRGNWSHVKNYPQGAELYTANLDGSDVKRLTNNAYYDAEVSLSPDGQWILFTRQINGRLDLWRMRPDGRDVRQITHSPDLQEGGSFYMPDSETILFRAWNFSDEDKMDKAMEIYTVKHDGTALTQLTHDGGVNWAPYPTPDGKHFVFAKMHPPYNYEIHLMNIKTGEQRQLTDDRAFDGFPSISPDGRLLSFSSSRGNAKGERKLSIFLMDISSLNVGPVPLTANESMASSH